LFSTVYLYLFPKRCEEIRKKNTRLRLYKVIRLYLNICSGYFIDVLGRTKIFPISGFNWKVILMKIFKEFSERVMNLQPSVTFRVAMIILIWQLFKVKEFIMKISKKFTDTPQGIIIIAEDGYWAESALRYSDIMLGAIRFGRTPSIIQRVEKRLGYTSFWIFGRHRWNFLTLRTLLKQ